MPSSDESHTSSAAGAQRKITYSGSRVWSLQCRCVTDSHTHEMDTMVSPVNVTRSSQEMKWNTMIVHYI